jgi:hypothetical protein
MNLGTLTNIYQYVIIFQWKHGLFSSSVVTNELPKSGSYATITTNNNVSIQPTPPLKGLIKSQMSFSLKT